MVQHNVSKVVYKPDTKSTEEFFVIVNPEEYKKWKEGDTTIPLVDVVDSFDVLHSNQGNQGIVGKASKQQLENVFGTSKDTDVVEKILKGGSDQPGEGFRTATVAQNDTKGSKIVDTRGRGLNGVQASGR